MVRALCRACSVVALPRIQKRSRVSSEARSAVTGKVVDSFTNIMTVKLFGRRKDEDDYISEGYSRLNDAFMSQQRMNTLYVAGLTFLNAVFLVATGAVAVWLFSANRIDAGTMTTALLLSTQIVSMSGWVAFEVMGIFENVGTVQEGMKTISRPLTMQDKPDARPLHVSRGEIRFENVSFSYGEGDTVHRRARPHHPARARRSASSAAPASARPRSSTCSCASSSRRRAASSSTGRTSPTSRRRACARRSPW